MHIRSVQLIMNAIIFGFIFCIIYKFSKNIFFIIILHGFMHSMIGFKPVINDKTKEIISPVVKYGIYITIIIFVISVMVITYKLWKKNKFVFNEKT